MTIMAGRRARKGGEATSLMDSTGAWEGTEGSRTLAQSVDPCAPLW
jgi:hypothetical protein